MLRTTILAASLAAACVSTGAGAVTLTFSGARENVTPVVGVPGGRCGGRITVAISPGNLSSTGTSNFGNFTSTQSHCIAGFPPNPFDDGIFTYSFASGDTLFGTYTGVAGLSATPGVFSIIENLIVTGGTGEFLGATGALTTNGSLRIGVQDGVRVTIFDGTISGMLNAPAIPEPATWAMMIAGFGLVGSAMRRRRMAAVVC